MFQARQADGRVLLALGRQTIEVILDFHDRRDRIARLAKEFQADGAGEFRHLVQDPARRRDQAVAAFFLDARQAGEEFVRHVLAQALFTELAARNFQDFRLERRVRFRRVARARVTPFQLETCQCDIVDLAQVMVQARDVEPVAVRVDHAPRGQVVQRRAPQHGLLAARIHGDVAADARSVGRGRVDGEHEASLFSRFRHFIRDHARARMDRRVFVAQSRQDRHFHRAQGDELFRVDDGRHRRQWNRAARVAGAAAARDDGQPQLDTALHQAGHFLFRVGREHDERIFDAPVGGVRHVRHARHAVEAHIVLFRVAAQHLDRALAQVIGLAEFVAEVGHGLAGRFQQQFHILAARLRHFGRFATGRDVAAGRIDAQAALVDFGQAVMQGIDQALAALRVVQQVILQVGVAAHDPDVAQHLVQHAGRTARLTGAAQLVEQAPGVLPQQAYDDLAIGKRRVVIRDFAQAACCGTIRRFCQ